MRTRDALVRKKSLLARYFTIKNKVIRIIQYSLRKNAAIVFYFIFSRRDELLETLFNRRILEEQSISMRAKFDARVGVKIFLLLAHRVGGDVLRSARRIRRRRGVANVQEEIAIDSSISSR